MSESDRWFLAVGLVLLDLVLFMLPITGVLAAYLLLARPPWFRDWVERLYSGA